MYRNYFPRCKNKKEFNKCIIIYSRQDFLECKNKKEFNKCIVIYSRYQDFLKCKNKKEFNKCIVNFILVNPTKIFLGTRIEGI
ncbi:unnamed protein product [Rhizophagus irregularis]|nr:unnamed protein product [Rhizophagus irregularis]